MDPQGSIDPGGVPGLPSKGSNRVIMAVATAVGALPLLGLVAYAFRECSRTVLADKVAEIPVAGLDRAVDAKMVSSAGSELVFGVHASYSYSGNSFLMRDVSLLRNGVEVTKTDCDMKDFAGIHGVGIGGAAWYGDWTCKLDVPAGGATSLRVKLRKAGAGSLELSDTAVVVKKP